MVAQPKDGGAWEQKKSCGDQDVYDAIIWSQSDGESRADR